MILLSLLHHFACVYESHVQIQQTYSDGKQYPGNLQDNGSAKRDSVSRHQHCSASNHLTELHWLSMPLRPQKSNSCHSGMAVICVCNSCAGNVPIHAPM